VFEKPSHSYYTLVASLPFLPRFDRAERLPINRVRLYDRLKMLQPEDAEIVKHVNAFLGFDHLPVIPSGPEIAGHYETLKASHPDASFWRILRFPIDLKTVLTGLRRRHLGHPRPGDGEPWGIGPLTGAIRRNWERPDFGLAPVFPWLLPAREQIESGEALALQKMTFDLVWEHVDRVSQGMEFRFDAVLAYLFKWDLLERWLSYNEEEAGVRFQELLTEALDGQEPIFA